MSCFNWVVLVYYSLGFLVLHIIADTLIRFGKPRFAFSFSLTGLLLFLLFFRCFFVIYISPVLSK